MLNDSAVLVCSGNTLLLEPFRSKRYFMLECIESEVIERSNCKHYYQGIFCSFVFHYIMR